MKSIICKEYYGYVPFQFNYLFPLLIENKIVLQMNNVVIESQAQIICTVHIKFTDSMLNN